jgi:hypothetical protein
MTADNVLDADVVDVRAGDLLAMQQCVTAAREVVRSVRASGSCPGSLTPHVEALALACGMGPLWDAPAPQDTGT